MGSGNNQGPCCSSAHCWDNKPQGPTPLYWRLSQTRRLWSSRGKARACGQGRGGPGHPNLPRAGGRGGMLGLMLSSPRLGVPRTLWGRYLTVFLGSQWWNSRARAASSPRRPLARLLSPLVAASLRFPTVAAQSHVQGWVLPPCPQDPRSLLLLEGQVPPVLQREKLWRECHTWFTAQKNQDWSFCFFSLI